MAKKKKSKVESLKSKVSVVIAKLDGGRLKQSLTNSRSPRRIASRNGILYVFLLTIFLLFPRFVDAATIETSYVDTYTINDTRDVLAKREITLTNTTATLYVSEYSFSFNNPGIIGNLSITEDTVPADFTQSLSDGVLRVTVTFKNPAIGKGTKKNILISYSLSGFLSDQGAYREMYIPVSSHSEAEQLKNYRVEVDTPADFPEVSIAKPKLSSFANHRYVWDDVQSLAHRNIFIAFSKKAFYKVELRYALQNNSPYAQKISIPFVPEGPYQKVYVESIEPPPSETSIDADDNYLGTYIMPAHEIIHVVYRGTIELTIDSRQDVREYFQKQFNKVGLGRYLTDEKYWNIPDVLIEKNKLDNLHNASDIYSFVTKTLSYDTGRINNDLARMGASWALENPSRAVCMEYSDLFIAIAREKGIPAREVVGYAVTNDSSLLPSSFFGDVLHAWPEYYDQTRQQWQHIDPTWGNTALVDYFTVTDLDHIAFVYHGKDTTYPLPPGVYKIRENTKDVYVLPVHEAPREERSVEVIMPSTVEFSLGSTNKMAVLIKSKSNVFLYDIPFVLRDVVTKKNLGSGTIDRLEPYGSRTYKIAVDSKITTTGDGGTFEIVINGESVGTREYTVRSSLLLLINQYRGVLIGLGIGIMVLIIIYLFR
ncbi:MAG: transglutaminase domain-containing protein [Patescibacteria group bacterium]